MEINLFRIYHSAGSIFIPIQKKTLLHSCCIILLTHKRNIEMIGMPQNNHGIKA